MENINAKDSTLKSKENNSNYSNENNYINVWEKDEDSIFHIVTTHTGEQEDVEVRICFGRVMITDKIFKTKEEAKAYIQTKPWDIIMNMVEVMITETNK